MAREAGACDIASHGWTSWVGTQSTEFLKRFEALVRADERNRTWTQDHWTEYERSIAAAEREACAKVCEELVPNMSRTANDASVWDVATFDCAEAIRARSKHD
jgi:hypothetical protein